MPAIPVAGEFESAVVDLMIFLAITYNTPIIFLPMDIGRDVPIDLNLKYQYVSPALFF